MTEREARLHCRRRDHRRCRVPGCSEWAHHLHHIVFRSHLAKADYWDTKNLVSLCAGHHALVHARLLSIEGDADMDLTIVGDDFQFLALACDANG